MILGPGRSAGLFGESDMRNVGGAFGVLFFTLVCGSALAGDEPLRALASAYNGFGQGIFSSLEKKKGNIVYSPYSAGVAFSMAMSGASGATRDEFLRVMGFSQSVAEIERANGALASLLESYAKERLDPSMLAESARLACLQKPQAKPADCEAAAQAVAKTSEPLTSLDVANLLAIAKGPVSPGYKSLIASAYGGEVFENATPHRINTWAAEKTNVVDWRPGDAPAFILANAVYFHGRWDQPFLAANTMPRPFTTASGVKADVSTMQKVETLACLDGEGFEMAWLPYQTEALGMMLVLPKKGSSPEAARAEKGVLSIDDVLQKTTLDVTEEGTLATAVTIVRMVATAARPQPEKPRRPKPFYVDRPFLFFIVDRRSGAMLFEGRIEDPR
jgi:serine protease inhibitor